MTTIQALRPNKYKPSVVKNYYWWAQTYTKDGQFITELFRTQPEALAKAYEYAALVEATK